MLAVGSRLGPYEIVAPLGAGGMGEVYRARDTRLGREVAVKVLPPHLADRAEARARFEREARTVGGLNHPHICTLFDVGREGDTEYLVLELLEGETLAARLARGPLPVPEALRLGAQIAEALGRMHEAGVVHRDLKPANVMLTRAGAKLVDFGLARLTLPESGGLLAGDAPTRGPAATLPGIVLGTVGYLAPEQVEGRPADERADLFALGVILHEMVTGRRAFAGDNTIAILHAVLTAEPPPLGEAAPGTPPALERLVRACLAKDPDARWQSAADLARAMRWLAEDSGAAPSGDSAEGGPDAGARARSAWLVPAALAMALVVLGLVALELATTRGERAGRRLVSALEPPPGHRLSARAGPMALSPDGRQIAFVAVDSSGTGAIWVRPLDSDEARVLPGTEGAACPFWSPDGRSLGYFAQDKLKRVDLAGGAPLELATVSWPAGGSWGRDGTILYAGHRTSPILRVPASGGASLPVYSQPANAPPRTEEWPAWLPDGRHFLFFLPSGFMNEGRGDAVCVGDAEGREPPRLLVRHAGNAVATADGRLLFGREGALWALNFDVRRLRVSGEPVRIADPVLHDADNEGTLFSVAAGGLLAYEPGEGADLSQLTLVDRAGRAQATLGAPGNYYSPRFSPDGRRLAVDLSDPLTGEGDIWVYDLARPAGDRITSDPANETGPTWSARGDRLFWMSAVGSKGPGEVHARALTGGGREETIYPTDSLTCPLQVTPDDRTLLVERMGGIVAGAPHLFLCTLSLADRKLAPWLASSFDERMGRLSPDGRWIAWLSTRTGGPEIWVSPFPGGGESWRVSTAGGHSPTWSGDGRELFYVSADAKLMRVAFDARPAVGPAGPVLGTPEPLFPVDLRLGPTGLRPEYDAAPDGRRFLLNRRVPAQAGGSITLVQHWGAAR